MIHLPQHVVVLVNKNISDDVVVDVVIAHSETSNYKNDFVSGMTRLM
jgi:hypothetical protein